MVMSCDDSFLYHGVRIICSKINLNLREKKSKEQNPFTMVRQCRRTSLGVWSNSMKTWIKRKKLRELNSEAIKIVSSRSGFNKREEIVKYKLFKNELIFARSFWKINVHFSEVYVHKKKWTWTCDLKLQRRSHRVTNFSFRSLLFSRVVFYSVLPNVLILSSVSTQSWQILGRFPEFRWFEQISEENRVLLDNAHTNRLFNPET